MQARHHHHSSSPQPSPSPSPSPSPHPSSLQAAITAEEAVAEQLRKASLAGAGGGPDVNPWGGGGGGELVDAGAAMPAAPPLRCGYPARPQVRDFDAPLELREVLEPGSVAAWQKRMTSLSYTRPKEMCGVEALKQLTDWLTTGISLGSDHRGFWLMYEMMTGTLNFKLLQDDSPYVLGALLTRLAARAGAEELAPLLRLLEREREVAAELP